MPFPAHSVIDPEAHVNDLHRMLGTLRLAAYATDAMRVFMRLEVHAAHHPELEGLMRNACPDWHNPGALHDPADMVTDVLTHLSSDLQSLIRTMDAELPHTVPPSHMDHRTA